PTRESVTNLKVRTAAIRSLVDDLKKLADEIDPLGKPIDKPDTDPESDFRKVMGEYDALALRLAKTSVGRLLATIPTTRKWTEGDVERAVGSDQVKIGRATKLLTFRDQVTVQATKAETAINERTSRMHSRATKKKEDLIPNIDEEITKNEQEIR